MIKKISLLLSLILIISCSNESDKDPINVLVDANKAAFEVKSASFTLKHKFKQSAEKYDATVKVKLQRVQRDSYPFNLRMEYDDGTIAIFNGDQYRWLDPKTNKVTFVSKEQNPVTFIEGNWIFNALKMVAQTDIFENEIRQIKDTMELVGSEKIGDVNLTKLYRTKFFQDYGVQLITYEYYDPSTKLQMRDSTVQVAMGDSVTFVYAIQDLKLNENLDAALFTLEPTNASDLVKYEGEEKAEELKEGAQAPDFELLDGSGNKVTLQSLKGKVVVLDFWGSWCKWCVVAMPKLEALRKEFESNKNVEVLGISCQEPENADPVKFMKEKNVNYRTLLKGDEVAQKFGVNGFPTLYVIDKNGKIVHSLVGFKDDMQKELSGIIKKHL